MTIQGRILDYLRQHPEGVDDDALTSALSLKQRQQANQRCRRLEQYGIVTRRPVDGKIRTFLNADAPMTACQSQSTTTQPEERPWYWEGNVQAAVVRQIDGLGYRIQSTADTASKQQGKDVVAIAPSGQKLWISVKGYPRGTPRTNPRTQARHWFAHAIFDLVLWHGEDPSVTMALAFPDQKTYRNLAARIQWLFAALNASIFWVTDDGRVVQQRPARTAAAP